MQTFKLNDFVYRQGLQEHHTTMTAIKQLRPLIGDSAWLAGGSMTALLRKERYVKDFDMFFKNREDLEFFRGNLEASGAVKVFSSEFADTYNFNERLIQLIFRKFYSSVEDIFSDFDLTISMIATDLEGNLYTHDYALIDLANKEIRIQHVNSLGHTFKRLIKYGKKGYHVHKSAYATMFALLQLNGTNNVTTNVQGVFQDPMTDIVYALTEEERDIILTPTTVAAIQAAATENRDTYDF